MNNNQGAVAAQGAIAQDVIAAPIAKVASAWGVVVVTSWADIASMLAAFYTLLLIGEWCWKKFIRPYAEKRGWVKPL